jgi:dihydrofolate synthase/folylpolyglutamate synthase
MDSGSRHSEPDGGWGYDDAERHLLSLELFGMRFGLERMEPLLAALGDPHRRFRAIHVVGTNGKSSTVRMAAAILRRHGFRVGSYLSPHLIAFTERIRLDDADVDAERFAAAVERATHAAAVVDARSQEDDRVTQFELLTAAAFDLFAREGADVAVVEAGLGGRYDATRVLDADVVALTNIGLEHTRWLGPTITDIAGEKLAVLRAAPPATLVIGEALDPAVRTMAQEAARERGAQLVVAPLDPGPGHELVARGAYQRWNFGLAMEAARALLGHLDDDAVRAAAASTLVPGRFHVLDAEGAASLAVLDGAHNPGGIEALAAALPAFLEGRPLVACLAVLDDKDAAAMLRTILPLCTSVVLTRTANPRALPPATLASLCHQLGFAATEVVSDPLAALRRARSLAGPDGVALATGSIYLIADLLRPIGMRRSIL